MTGPSRRRESHPLDLDAMPHEVAGALVEVIATGLKAGALAGYPTSTVDEVCAAWRLLRGRAAGASPAFGTESATRQAAARRASSRHEQWMGTSEAADVLGITPQRVGQLATERDIGRKVGGRWVLTADEIEALRRRNAA